MLPIIASTTEQSCLAVPLFERLVRLLCRCFYWRPVKRTGRFVVVMPVVALEAIRKQLSRASIPPRLNVFWFIIIITTVIIVVFFFFLLCLSWRLLALGFVIFSGVCLRVIPHLVLIYLDAIASRKRCCCHSSGSRSRYCCHQPMLDVVPRCFSYRLYLDELESHLVPFEAR